jgi:uncharacterized protein
MVRYIFLGFRLIVFGGLVCWNLSACLAASPSYSCSKVKEESIEALVCADESLAALDRQLAGVYAQAIARLGEDRSMELRIEQRGWIRSRDACSTTAEPQLCALRQYSQRIAELQATYRLVPMTGPVLFFCEDPARTKLYVTYYATDPATIIVEHHNQFTLMYLEPGMSGARYVRKSQSFWEHQGEALVSWGFDMPEIQCRTRSQKNAR